MHEHPTKATHAAELCAVATAEDIFSVVVWSRPPGFDEFMAEREGHIMVVAPDNGIARAAAMANTPYATAAQVDAEGTTFLRSGQRDPYEGCEHPAAARARDRFLGSRTAEIMADDGIGAVAAYRRAVAELEGGE